ncbi:MAG: hemerythrin domain-containing protein [Candidatus Kariarchaeaceae archaeon]|jgi:hemerythrin-like domain-containing protein
MYDPIEELRIEHQNILRGMELLELTGTMVQDGAPPTNEISLLISFFRGYADKAHHVAEEKIFFSLLKEKDPSLASDLSPLTILEEQHIEARRLLGVINDVTSQYSIFVLDYSDLLRRHIDMEDELFPRLAGDYLTPNELQIMAVEFDNTRAALGSYELLGILDKIEVKLM